MEIPALKADRREVSGTKAMRKARAEGNLPGVLYGKGQENVNLLFNYRDVEDLIEDATHVVEINLGAEKQYALVRALQRDHLGDNLQHIDFVRVDLEDKVKLRIPMAFLGTPKGASNGGMLEVIRGGVEANLRAKNIPKLIEVEVTSLGVDDQFRFKDISLPEGAELLENPEGIVVRCAKARRAAALETAAAGPTDPAAVPSTVGGEAKPAEEGEKPKEDAKKE